MPAQRRAGRGQIVVPAMFVLPSLMLFVYLLFETAKLSREKIRMQFAVDTAAFIDISNYADLLNRTAYVNGAFPSRVFQDAFSDRIIDMKNETDHIPLLQILWERGVFPTVGGGWPPADGSQLNRADRWNIEYAQKTNDNWARNDLTNMNQAGNPDDLGSFNVLGGWTAQHTWIFYDDAVSIWQLVSQIFSLLGSVYEAQVKVNERLMGSHSFYKKSWMLNTDLPDSTASDGLQQLMGYPSLQTKCHYVSRGGTRGLRMEIRYPYTTELGWPYGFDDDPAYRVAGTGGAPYVYNGEQSDVGCQGLFQYATVQSGLNELMNGAPPGYKVSQSWTAPGNYFNVDVNRLGNAGGPPFVHVTTAISGPPDVWPDPTPRFQTRQYP